MRVIGAAVVVFLAVVPGWAQQNRGSAVGFGNVVFPGLGHAPAGGNPWGSVVHPGIPSTHVNSSTHRNSGAYAYPVYVGGFGYGYGYGYGSGYGYDPNQAAPQQQPNVTVVYPPAQPPVVINQYMGAQPGDQGQGTDTASNMHYYQAPSGASTDAPPAQESSYYLVAFKDHTIYSAVAYYVEGDTLHYFTEGNVHNQVSVSLVDRQLTEQLNRERNVNVQLPKQ